jgi:long-subunit fatty acid transport protein
MKKLLASLFVLGLIITGTSAFALNHNMSIEYTRTMNRTAAIAEDSCFFNPAGAAFLKDGLYVGVGNQMIFRTQTVTEKDNALIANYSNLDEKEYEGVITALVFPSLGITFKTGSLAAFWHTGVYGGGAGGTYDEGLPMFAMTMVGTSAAVAAGAAGGPYAVTAIDFDASFEGSEFKIGSQIGAAYAINDMLSVALAGRMFYLMKSTVGEVKNLSITTTSGVGAIDDGIATAVGSVDLDAEESGLGWGAVVGVDVRPMKELNVGIKFEYNFKMESEVKVNKIDAGAYIKPTLEGLFSDGDKKVVTEPMEAWLGVDYTILPNLIVSASFGYVFTSMKDIDDSDTTTEETNDDLELYKDKIMGGIGVEFKPMPELAVSVGYLYDGKDYDDNSQSELDWGTTTHYVSGGVTYAIMPELDATVTCTYAITSDESQDVAYAGGYTGAQEYKRNTISFGIGVNYRMVSGADAATETAPAEEKTEGGV